MKILLVFLLYCPFLLWAQSYRPPIEKIFLTTDQMTYHSGDSLFVCGQVIREDTAFYPYSRYAYVEMFDARDSVLLRQRVACEEKGDFYTQIPLEYEWADQVYYIRAYTKFMQNFQPETFPVVPIRLGDRKTAPEASDIQCAFFPEGGHWVDGIPQSLSISFSRNNGEPVRVSYVVTNQQEDTIAVQTTTSSGWQIIRMTPQQGERYMVNTIIDGNLYRFLLPDRKVVPTLQAGFHYGKLAYKVLFSEKLPLDAHLYLFHPGIGLQEITLNNPEGVIQLDSMSDGLAILALTDGNKEILSQRTVWVGNAPRGEAVKLKTTYFPGETLDLGEIVEGYRNLTAFVRILPAGDPGYIPRSEVGLNYESELRSPLCFPAHYCNEDNSEKKTDLAAWLYSASSKRLDIKRQLQQGFSYAHRPEGNLVFRGQVKTKSGRPVANGNLIAYHTNKGLTYEATTDAKGLFTIAVDDFKEGDSFFMQAYDVEGKSNYYNYYLQNDTFPIVANWNRVREDNPALQVEWDAVDNRTFSFDKVNKLPELIVKARVRAKDYIPTNKFYSHRFMDRERIAKRNYVDFFSLLRKFPMIRITQNEEGKYSIESTRQSTLSGGSILVILLDGNRITADELFTTTSLNDVYSVELLSPWQTLEVVSGAVNGVLVVKTMIHQVNKEKVSPQGILYTPMGIANLNTPHPPSPIHAPTVKGTYRLLVDLLSKEKGIRTIEKIIKIE